jgi:hypothetical protein
MSTRWAAAARDYDRMQRTTSGTERAYCTRAHSPAPVEFTCRSPPAWPSELSAASLPLVGHGNARLKGSGPHHPR